MGIETDSRTLPGARRSRVCAFSQESSRGSGVRACDASGWLEDRPCAGRRADLLHLNAWTNYVHGFSQYRLPGCLRASCSPESMRSWRGLGPRARNVSRERLRAIALYAQWHFGCSGLLRLIRNPAPTRSRHRQLRAGVAKSVGEERHPPLCCRPTATLFMKNRTQHIDPCGKIANGARGPCYDPPTLFCPE
jgi:hypothetical protein